MVELETVKGSQRSAWHALLLWLGIVAALTVMFYNTFREMWIRWFPAWRTAGDLYHKITGGESYYTHGPLVPLVSLVIVLLLVRHVRIPVRPQRALGGIVLGLSLLLHLVACLARVNFVSGFAFIGVLCGLVLIFWGLEALKRLWFPIAFLIFMVPLPEVSIANLNFRLKMWASTIGVFLANLCGVMCERSGDWGNEVILSGDKRLVIANVCNGLRTLISLLAFGALYAYVCKLRGLWRVGLFLASIVVAVIANSVRILGLLIVADIWDEKVATGWFHDSSGILIFVLAFLLMFALEKAVLAIRAGLKRPAKIEPLFAGLLRTDQDEGQAGKLAMAVWRPSGMVSVVILGIAMGGTLWVSRSLPAVFDKQMAKKALPQQLSVAGAKWPGEDLELSQQEMDILETRDALVRQFRSAGTFVEISIIFSEDNRKGTHPPDLCLEGGGQDIVSKQNLEVTGVQNRGSVSCRELVTRQGQASMYYLYTYKCGREYTDSFYRQQWVVLLNGLLARNASGALIRVRTPVYGNDIVGARRRAVAFMQAGIPHIDTNLP